MNKCIALLLLLAVGIALDLLAYYANRSASNLVYTRLFFKAINQDRVFEMGHKNSIHEDEL